MLMSFARRLPGSGSGAGQYGNRAYGWADKTTFGMSVNEICAWLADHTRRHTFLHDPGKCTGAQGFRVLGCAGFLEFKGAWLCCFMVLGCARAAGFKCIRLWWGCRVLRAFL